ncbi:mitochondrial 37S ribosomal protein uS17m [Lipomyces chichibuensis]|uniref:mitochondrial 37S ribosomal protein uS17m n=1 Tax=Lipomyces chichibuensis TaxID=1546026 RepID=UPI00334362A2
MRQNFVGLVVSQGKMAKTIKVQVQIPVQNSRYKMVINKRRDFLVHDEGDICREGDIVRIESTRPLSARKFFAVAEVKTAYGQELQKYKNYPHMENTYRQYIENNRGRLLLTKEENAEYNLLKSVLDKPLPSAMRHAKNAKTYNEDLNERKRVETTIERMFQRARGRKIQLSEDGLPTFVDLLPKSFSRDFMRLFHRQQGDTQGSQRN